MYSVIENERRKMEIPLVTVSTVTGVGFNKASAKYLEGFNQVLLLFDEKNKKLAIKPVNNDLRAYSIIRAKWQTRITTKKWRSLGVKPGRYQASWSEKDGLLEIDLNKQID